MKYTAAEYEMMAAEEITEGNYVAAQVFATLSLAAATLEATERPVISSTTEISEHVDSVMRDRARMIEEHKLAYT